jgi:hypothetical protein
MGKHLGLIAAGLAASLLAACDNHDDHDWGFEPIPPNWDPVSLVTLSDAERELANISTTIDLTDISGGAPDGAVAGVAAPRALGPGHAAVRSFAAPDPQARAAQVPHATDPNCSAGGSDTVSTGSGSRTFSYFSNVTTNVDYRVDRYAGCANTANGITTTLDGRLESGSGTASATPYQYVALGDFGANNTLTEYSDGDPSGLHTQQDFFGLIEASGAASSTLDMRSNLYSTLFASQPGQPDYDGSFQIGDDGGVYEVIRSSTSLNVGGTYAYASTACLGGAVTVSTPAVLGLGTTSAGSGLPVSGTLTVESGRNSVSYTFNADGSATLSGSVSGTLSASQVGQLLQNGTSC